MSNRKQYLWLPNTNTIQSKNKSVKFIYKGGQLTIDYKNIHSIMFYADTCDLSQLFLGKCASYKIPIVMHSRSMPNAIWITPSITSNKEDLLSRQVLYRRNEKKRSYISKKLLIAKFKSMEWLQPSAEHNLKYITSINEMTNVEAWHAKEYWKKYYKLLGETKFTRRLKNDENYIKSTLDASSKFISGILLRWVHYHHMSPFHGFIHKPTDYPTLIYDLMEPYRGYIDKCVFQTIDNNLDKDITSNKLIALTIENIKTFLDTPIYINATRQVVTFHELYHGLVLSLRSYLLGNKRFIVPTPGVPNGGRPINAGYKLYGRNAGITNFWPETKIISNEFNNKYINLNQSSIQSILG